MTALFHPDTDWLYNDANAMPCAIWDPRMASRRQRATYARGLLVADDNNHDGALNVGEALLALGTSKSPRSWAPVALNTGAAPTSSTARETKTGTGHRRPASWPGGSLRSRRYVGVAPRRHSAAGRIAGPTTTPVTYPWAEQNGARVMLYEFGSMDSRVPGWLIQFRTDAGQRVGKGIVQVAPAGNLSGWLPSMRTPCSAPCRRTWSVSSCRPAAASARPGSVFCGTVRRTH